MTNPIDILEEALRLAEQQHKAENDPTSKYWGYRLYTKAAVETITGEEFVTAAAHALFEDPAADGKDWAQCEQIARTVLRSVGGA